jgi:hypothetical protein
MEAGAEERQGLKPALNGPGWQTSDLRDSMAVSALVEGIAAGDRVQFGFALGTDPDRRNGDGLSPIEILSQR